MVKTAAARHASGGNPRSAGRESYAAVLKATIQTEANVATSVVRTINWLRKSLGPLLTFGSRSSNKNR
jgi:hypothetical protein